MGNANSAALSSLDDTAGAPPSEGLSLRSARLYVYDATTSKWTVARALVEVDFADDAAEGDAPDWHVEVRALKPWGTPAVACCPARRNAPEPPRVACVDRLCDTPPDAALRDLVACLRAP